MIFNLEETPEVAYSLLSGKNHNILGQSEEEIKDYVLLNEEYLIDLLKQDPWLCYYYCSVVLDNERWLEVEDVIMTDTKAAYFYASYILKTRWPEAEQYIAKDFDVLNFYKDNVIVDDIVYQELVIQYHPDKINSLQNIDQRLIEKYNLQNIIEIRDSGVEL